MPNNEDADVELAKKTAQVERIRRKARLDSIKDYLGFFVSQGIGSITLIGGLIGQYVPTLLPFTLNSPISCIALGLSLLLGKKAVTILSKVTDALKS